MSPLRAKRPGKKETDALVAKLADMDRRSRRGPWTRQHLELIEARPGELAETIAASIGRETSLPSAEASLRSIEWAIRCQLDRPR